jgi:hypothetical protein
VGRVEFRHVVGSLSSRLFVYRFNLLANQHAIAITVKTVAGVDGMFVSREYIFVSGECADQCKQRGTRQVKVGQQSAHHSEVKSWKNKQACFGFSSQEQSGRA